MKDPKQPEEGPWGLLRSLWACLVQIAFFWQLVSYQPATSIGLISHLADRRFQRLYQWWKRPTRKQLLLDTLAKSQVFEEWLGAAYMLDDLEENSIW